MGGLLRLLPKDKVKDTALSFHHALQHSESSSISLSSASVLLLLSGTRGPVSLLVQAGRANIF
jgi:hypothetical protein